MGETVQAFSEWVMSTNIQPDNNPAEKYLVAIQQDKGKVSELQLRSLILLLIMPKAVQMTWQLFS